MKKIVKVSVVFVLLVALCCQMVACKKNNENPSFTEMGNVVDISKESIQIVQYLDYQLTATVYDADGNQLNETVQWSSADITIASVIDGKVSAHKAGETVISAKCGDVAATCRVQVRAKTGDPYLRLDKEEVAIIADDAGLTVKSCIYYENTEFTDAEFAYTISDTGIAVVTSQGNSAVVKGIKKGTTDLTVTAKWRGLDESVLIKTIPITVNELLILQFEDSTARTVYTNTIEDHAMTTTLTPVIKANGQVVADPSVSWKVYDESGAASDLVTVDSQGIVSANENGKSGTAYVSYIYNAVESAKVAIHVEYPVVDRTDIKVDVEFDAEGKVAVTAIEEKLTTPVVDVVGYEFAEGKVQNAVAGETTWKVLNGEQYVCEVSVVVCTKIIRTADDLDSMMDLATKEKVGDLQYNVLAKPHYSYDGYFILGANIDYQNKVYDSGTMQLMLNQCASNAITANVGFKGTFDGRGYTIKNIEFFASGAGDLLSSNPDDPRAIDWEAETGVAGQQYRGNEFTCGGGLFGAIAQTGVVKNLCLANVTLADCTGSAPLATNLSGTVDNVNIQIVKTGMSTNIRVAGIAVGTMGAKIQNTFIYLAPGAIGHRTYYGWISCLDYKTVDSRISFISEVYVIRTYGGDRYWASENEPYANPYDPAKATAGNSGGAPFKDLKVYQKDGEKLSPAKPNLEDYLTDLENGTITFNGYDKNIWNFDTADKYPTFKTNC